MFSVQDTAQLLQGINAICVESVENPQTSNRRRTFQGALNPHYRPAGRCPAALGGTKRLQEPTGRPSSAAGANAAGGTGVDGGSLWCLSEP